MTERWRKRLSDLDKQSPTEDLFERAKGGPQLPDEPISRPSTTTRVVTSVAAFVVFALAISVFAIPALRLKGGSGVLGAPHVQLPLWPVRTMDEVRLVQAKEDDSPSVLGAPRQVAQAFGANVMGWKDFQTDEIPSAVTAYTVPSVGPLCDPAFPSCGGSTASALTGYDPIGPSGASSAASSPFRAFRLIRTVCAGDACSVWIEYVLVFQPDRKGPGGVWMVLRAQADGISIPYQPGDAVSDGASIDAIGSIDGANAILGYQAGEGSCSTSAATREFALSEGAPVVGPSPGDNGADAVGVGLAHAHLGVTLPATVGCAGGQPGYLYAASFDGSFGAPDLGDPILHGGATVNQLTAVPVTFEWPEPQVTGSSPSANADLSRITYSDPLGWTIDVPTAWTPVPFQRNEVTASVAGTAFFSGPQPAHWNDPPTSGVSVTIFHSSKGTVEDDSSFPLDPTKLGDSFIFRGDGLEFTAEIQYAPGADRTSLGSIVDRMVSSIVFKPWYPGDIRNGLGVVDLPSSPSPSWKDAGVFWVDVPKTQGTWTGVYVAGANVVLGPMPICGDGARKTASTSPRGPVLDCPDGTTQGWTVDGKPFTSNGASFQDPVPVHPIFTMWDGTLVTSLAMTTG